MDTPTSKERRKKKSDMIRTYKFLNRFDKMNIETFFKNWTWRVDERT